MGSECTRAYCSWCEEWRTTETGLCPVCDDLIDGALAGKLAAERILAETEKGERRPLPKGVEGE